MAQVDMTLVKKLRQATQVGLMDCKNALIESEGDMDKATEILRKKGAAIAAKRADQAVDNGRIEAFVASDFKHGALAEIGCETEFSANTDAMKNFAIAAAKKSTEVNTNVPQELLEKNADLKKLHEELLAKITERIEVNRLANFTVDGHGLIMEYIHPGSTVGVMIELSADKGITAHLETLKSVARDICMHIAVMKPLGVSSAELDQALIDKEKAFIQDQLKDESNKPANIIEKIATGRMNKYFKSVCLLNQPFIKRDSVTIEQYIKEVADKINTQLSVKQFVRFAIGNK